MEVEALGACRSLVEGAESVLNPVRANPGCLRQVFCLCEDPCTHCRGLLAVTRVAPGKPVLEGQVGACTQKWGVCWRKQLRGGRMHGWGLEGEDLLGIPCAHPVPK